MRKTGSPLGCTQNRTPVIRNARLERDYYAARSAAPRAEPAKRRHGDGRLATQDREKEVEQLIRSGVNTESKAQRAGISVGLFNRVLGNMQMRGELT